MLDVRGVCSAAIWAVFWLVLRACHFLGYSPIWVQNAWKRRQQEEYGRLQHVPTHVAVLFSDRGVSKRDLTCLLEQCLGFGICRLSLFDPWGDCASLADELSNSMKNKDIEISRESDAVPDTKNTNGLTGKMSVRMLTPRSGKAALVDVCKKMSYSEEPVRVTDIAQMLADKHGVDEPELLIHVGQTPSLCGYPPFALRVTEIVQTCSIPKSRNALEDCLVGYSLRDKRLGRFHMIPRVRMQHCYQLAIFLRMEERRMSIDTVTPDATSK